MSQHPAKEALRGVVIAVPTPFRDDLSLDTDTLKENVRFLVEQGLRRGRGALLITGAGGEYPHLTVEERKEATEAAVQAARGEGPIFGCATHTSQLHAV